MSAGKKELTPEIIDKIIKGSEIDARNGFASDWHEFLYEKDCKEFAPEMAKKITALEQKLGEYEETLKFYASCGHFDWCGKDDFAPENPSGEPINIECGGGEGSEFTLENG